MTVTRRICPLALLCVLASSALLAPAANASASPTGAVKAAKKKPVCKRNVRRKALDRRHHPRSWVGIAAKKCVQIVRAYRGKTSQGESIELKTRTTEFGTKLVSGKLKLHFLVRQECTSPSGSPYKVSEEFNDLDYPKLRGPARKTTFKATIPSFDSEYEYLASVTGKVGVANASGSVNVSGDDVGQCAATSFTFDIPRVKNHGGF